jgi:hypothetical protein
MTDNSILEERRLGARYRIDQPDGTWWELGWDRPLGTFYAQHWSPEPYDPFTPDEPLAWHGTDLAELTTVASLAATIGVAIPDDVADALQRDAHTYPHTLDPPFLGAARAFRDAATVSAPARSTLPAEPVAQVLANLRRDPYLAADNLTAFAHGLGIDADLTRAILDGTARDLDVDQIANICEGLRCSPFDLWGAQLGREILDAYGPERWPRHIEPLEEGRTREVDDTFIRRRIEQQAADVVHVEGSSPAVIQLEVTRFRQNAVIAVDEHGVTERVSDTLQPADPSREYHFAFHRVGEPEQITVRLSTAEFAAGCPAGHDATPTLVDVADRLERAGLDADMLRFRDPASGAEQWLGRDTPFDTWQTWDDPRRYYPGDPTDVLDERLLDLTSPALPFTPDDAGLELDDISIDF